MAEICSPLTSTSGSRAPIAGGFQRNQSCYMAPQKTSDKKLFEDEDDEQEVEENRMPKYHHHFLDSCFLCKRRLDGDDDIFMYMGEMAFCSEECREQHIELEELKERRRRRRGIVKKRSTVKVSRENPSSSSHSATITVDA